MTSNAPVSSIYLKIETDGGAEGLYGPIDKEVAIVVDQQLRRFLMGKDALAQEKLGPVVPVESAGAARAVPDGDQRGG